MKYLVVSAHDDPKSLVSALFNTTLGVLQRNESDEVLISDLFSTQFHPTATGTDFSTRATSHVNYMLEQQRASNTSGGFSPDIEKEIEKLKSADTVILHFPLWWGSTPAVLKGWIDRVFAMGVAWDSRARYEHGLLKGKSLLCVITTGDPESFYTPEGQHHATVEQHLYSLLHSTFAMCGMSVYHPYVIYDTTAGSQQSIEEAIEKYRTEVLPSLATHSRQRLF